MDSKWSNLNAPGSYNPWCHSLFGVQFWSDLFSACREGVPQNLLTSMGVCIKIRPFEVRKTYFPQISTFSKARCSISLFLHAGKRARLIRNWPKGLCTLRQMCSLATAKCRIFPLIGNRFCLGGNLCNRSFGISERALSVRS